MASQKCRENIAKIGGSAGVPCTDAYCREVNFINDEHCLALGLGPDDPIGPNRDPNLNGPGRPGYCYCCCSCFSSRTPIEVSPGEFALASEIEDGELILAAGTGLHWKPRRVEQTSSWEDDSWFAAMYLVRYEYPDGAEQARVIMVSPDHLFLMEDNTLLAVQNLTKVNLKLKRADGGLSRVLLVAQGSFFGGITSITMEGEFDGKNLDGHLLNSNGIVSADFKVQIYYSSGHLNSRALHQFSDKHENLPVGTAEYHAIVPNEAYTAFVNDPGQWPKGFDPTRRREIIPPAGARRFLTKAQADDIRKNAPMGSAGNTFPAQALLYLFSLARGFYPKTDFLLDWDSETPNAYTWTEWGRQMVVVTGGLVRTEGMRRDGLSLVVSAMLAYQEANVNCVGEADYTGVAIVMRRLWNGDLFVDVVDEAIPQIEKLFSHISKKNAEGDPDLPCIRPSITCRLQAYDAALSSYPVPDCARPRPDYFAVRDARAIGLDKVQITFSRALNAATAETTENYTFDSQVKVREAKLSPTLPNQVVLSVSALKPDTLYTVKVVNVVSNDGVPLDPDRSTGAFTTEP